jgi:hypothetical protein
MKNNFCTLRQAAEEIGCHHATVFRHVRAMELGYQIGQQILLTPAEVKKLRKVIKPRKGV